MKSLGAGFSLVSDRGFPVLSRKCEGFYVTRNNDIDMN